MDKQKIATWSELEPVQPTYALVSNVDLVIVRWENEEEVSVLYGRCLHRGALLSDGEIRGEDLICGVHSWDYRYKTPAQEGSVAAYLESAIAPSEALVRNV